MPSPQGIDSQSKTAANQRLQLDYDDDYDNKNNSTLTMFTVKRYNLDWYDQSLKKKSVSSQDSSSSTYVRATMQSLDIKTRMKVNLTPRRDPGTLVVTMYGLNTF